MHETTAQAKLCKTRATWNEVGMHLCWMCGMFLCVWLCSVMFGRVSMFCWLRQCWRRCVGCCVVFKKVQRDYLTPLRFKLIQTKQITNLTVLINSKTIKSAPHHYSRKARQFVHSPTLPKSEAVAPRCSWVTETTAQSPSRCSDGRQRLQSVDSRALPPSEL